MNDKTAQRLVEELQHIGLVVLNFNSLGGIIQQIPRRSLNLLHDHAGRLHVRDRDIAAFIGTVFAASIADRSAVSSSYAENGTGQRFLGNGIHLLDDQIAQGSVLEGEFVAGSALYLNGMNGVIQQIAILGFGFGNCITAAGDALEPDRAVAVGGVDFGRILTAIAPGNFELHAAQRFLSNTVHLGDQQTTIRIIINGDGLGIACIDHNRLAAGCGVDGVAVNGLLLGYNQSAIYSREFDLTIGIRHIDALSGEFATLSIHKGAVRIGDFELHTFQGLFCDGIQLIDDEIAFGLVTKLQRHGGVGLNLDALGCLVQNVAFSGLCLLHH